MANHYEIPSWAGKPPIGLHLDVLKGDRLIQKLMIDEKKCYLFGRNTQLNDFVIDHASCSRVHSALVYHKHLNRAFLVDLGSTHGTFIGSVRLERQKPTQLPVDSNFHFGASTRNYILRERPHKGSRTTDELGDEIEGGLLGLPETETELDNLTEFNTAHNRRISMLGIPDEEIRAPNRKRKGINVKFCDEEDIINPEDVDPSVGKFRNLIHTAVIPTKKLKTEGSLMGVMSNDRRTDPYGTMHSPPYGRDSSHINPLFSPTLSAKLGIHLPNPAPDVELAPIEEEVAPIMIPSSVRIQESNMPPEPKKKKYAKEAWPGKKPVPSLLV